MLLRVAESFAIGVLAFAADVEVGIEAGFEGQHLDVEFLLDQKA